MAITILLLFGLSGCGQNPKIDVLVKVKDGKVVFDVPRSDVRGLLRITVKDESGETLWAVNLSYENGQKITYGEVPPGGDLPATQEVPDNGSTPPEIWGRQVLVEIRYQFDQWGAASSSTLIKTVQVPPKPDVYTWKSRGN